MPSTPQPNHEARIIQIENHAEQNFSHNPADHKALYRELQALKRSESKAQFEKDLAAINSKLHQDGWLPAMEIVMKPKGGFSLRRQNNREWQAERQRAQQQYNNRQYEAPAPQATPGGYSSGYSPRGGRSGRGGYAPQASYDPSSRGSSGNFRYNPNVSGDAAQRILQTGHNDIHQQMWRLTNHGASGANEGCAASVSAVLRQAGVSNVNEMSCAGLQKALVHEGWTMTNSPSPGDVVIGYGGLSRGHTGIVDVNGKVMDNHSSTGQWSSDSLSYFNNWNQVVFLHPPQAHDNPTPAPVHEHAAASPVVAPTPSA